MKIAYIIRMIREGIDPSTGEVFDRSILTTDPEIRREVSKLAITVFNTSKILKAESENRLNRNSNALFEDLKQWRLDMSRETGIPAYEIFTDKQLWNIAEGDVCFKDDLLLIKGMSISKYELYGDDLFDIIKDYIKADDSSN